MWKNVFAVAVTSALVSAVVAFAVVQWQDEGGGGREVAAVPTATAAASSSTAGPAASGQTSLVSGCLPASEVYSLVRPSVVDITSTRGGGGAFGPQAEGTGSGIVIDDSGYVLTNYHVVSAANRIEVTFEDGTTAAATLLGRDAGNDLAVLEVDLAGRTVSPATLGESAGLQAGDAVLALGSPFQLEGTLTQGIVSAVGRTYSPGGGTRPLRNLIQTDAPVNPGNSGGPLLDCRGNVIGVNTLLENPTGQGVNVGVAFAVPVDTVKRFLPELLASQTVSHPWLGIAGEAVTPALAAEIDLTTDAGVYVTLVADNSPAEAAGLRGAFNSEGEAVRSTSLPGGGDVIVAADGVAVASVDDLATYLDTQKVPGDSVELEVIRDGEELSITATLAEWPS